MSVIRRFIVFPVIDDILLLEQVSSYVPNLPPYSLLLLVGHGLATSYVENPSTNFNSNEEEETDYNSYDQTPLSNSLDDDYRQTKSMTYSSDVTTRSTAPMTHRPTSVNVSSGSGFKATSVAGNMCSRCSKTVYSAEEVKAAGKVYHNLHLYSFESASIRYFSPIINNAIDVHIVKQRSVVVGILYVMTNSTIIVRQSIVTWIGYLEDFFSTLDCYQRLFGPRGVGFGMGAGTLSTGN